MAAGDVWGMSELTILGVIARGEPLTGYAILKQTGLANATVYQALERFEKAGYVRAEVERVDPVISERTPRRFFRGTTVANDVVRDIQRRLTPASA